MAKRIEDLKVVANRRLNSEYFVLELVAGGNLPEMYPGQFIQVKVDGSPETFLRRPLSIHDVDHGRNLLKILVQIAGKGTEKLSSLLPGEFVNVIYPLGNSFSVPPSGSRILLTGGGCGVAPLLFLGRHLKSVDHEPEILLGFRNASRILELEEYSSLGKVHVTTEDGSFGEKGFVTGHSRLRTPDFDKVFCCGPEPMMKAVAAYCLKNGIECEVSLENLMGCGFGVCLCCIVDTVRGNLCTCTEGPVFNIKDLKW
jgi:dihydroorotate dehydrogenase electron transfer subunit